MTNQNGDVGWILWCGLGGLTYYPQQNRDGGLEAFLDHCQAAGVDELVFYFSFVHGGEPAIFRLAPNQRPFDPSKILATFELYSPQDWDPWQALVDAAHSRNLWLTGYTSPNYQGAVQANPDSPLGERLPFLYLSEFANSNPQCWSRDSQGQDSLARSGYVQLSMASASTRDHLARVLAGLACNKGLDGLEMEWICGAEEKSPYGGESPEQEGYGVSTFLSQLRRELGPDKVLSVAVDDNLARSQNWSYDWAAWAAAGLVNRVVLRHRGQNLAQIAERVRRARALVPPDIKLVSQLDCWRANGLRDGQLIAQAVEAVRQAGADTVGIYRADAVEKLALWESLAALSTKSR